jgi:hypothetical protein
LPWPRTHSCGRKIINVNEDVSARGTSFFFTNNKKLIIPFFYDATFGRKDVRTDGRMVALNAALHHGIETM